MYYKNEIKRLKQVRRELKAEDYAVRLIVERGLLSITLTAQNQALTLPAIQTPIYAFLTAYEQELRGRRADIGQEIVRLRKELLWARQEQNDARQAHAAKKVEFVKNQRDV